MTTKKDLEMKIYNEKGELQHEETKNYDIIQKHFADYMFLKYVIKMGYIMKTKYNYEGYYTITFIDKNNKWKTIFDGVTSESLRWL